MKIKIPCSTEVLIFLLMFPIIKPDSLREMFPIVENAFDIGRLVSVTVILIIRFNSYVYKSFRVNLAFALLVLLEGWIIVITAVNNPERFTASIINGCAVISVVFIIDCYAHSNPKALIRALMLNFEWVIYVNLLTLLLVPNGLYKFRNHPCFFLGLKNSFFIYMLPALGVSFIYIYYFNCKVRPLILISAILLSIFIGWSGTSVVGMISFIFIYIVLHLSYFGSKVKLLHIWVLSIVANILIAIVRIMDSFPPLQKFITLFLRKSTSLSGRTVVWDEVLKLFKESPIIGHGYGTKVDYGSTFVGHAHNAYYQYLLIGGIIGLVLFILYNYFVIVKFDNLYFRSNLIDLMKCLVGVLFIAFISEACNYPLMFAVYALVLNIENFINLDNVI